MLIGSSTNHLIHLMATSYLKQSNSRGMNTVTGHQMLSRNSSAAINRCPLRTLLFSCAAYFHLRINTQGSNAIFATTELLVLLCRQELCPRASTLGVFKLLSGFSFCYLGGWFNIGSCLWFSLLACARQSMPKPIQSFPLQRRVSKCVSKVRMPVFSEAHDSP